MMMIMALSRGSATVNSHCSSNKSRNHKNNHSKYNRNNNCKFNSRNNNDSNDKAVTVAISVIITIPNRSPCVF